MQRYRAACDSLAIKRFLSESLNINLLCKLHYIAFTFAVNNDYVVISCFQHVFDFSEVDFSSKMFVVFSVHLIGCCRICGCFCAPLGLYYTVTIHVLFMFC